MISFIPFVAFVTSMPKDKLSLLWEAVMFTWEKVNAAAAVRDRSKDIIDALTETIAELEAGLRNATRQWSKHRDLRSKASSRLNKLRSEKSRVESQLKDSVEARDLLDAIIKKARSQPGSGSHLQHLYSQRRGLTNQITSLRGSLSSLEKDIFDVTHIVLRADNAMKRLSGVMHRIREKIKAKKLEKQKEEHIYRQAVQDEAEWIKEGRVREREYYETLEESVN